MDTFEDPGECDITADVDFSVLKTIAQRSNSKANTYKTFLFLLLN